MNPIALEHPTVTLYPDLACTEFSETALIADWRLPFLALSKSSIQAKYSLILGQKLGLAAKQLIIAASSGTLD
jgi:hypothetical protein